MDQMVFAMTCKHMTVADSNKCIAYVKGSRVRWSEDVICDLHVMQLLISISAVGYDQRFAGMQRGGLCTGHH